MEWQAIASLAEEIFDIWVGSGDVRWAEQAWSVLDTAGLVDDSDEIERSISIVRLLCLATYYYEFIKDYQFEELEFDLEELYGSVPIPAFRLGQLVGDHVLLKDEKDQDALCQRSLQILIDRYSGETVDALEEGFGGRCSLFLSLCRSTRHDSENVESIDFIPDSEIFDTQLPSGEFVAHLFGCSIKEEKQKFKSSDNALPILQLKFPDGIRQDINSLKVVHRNGSVFLETPIQI